MADYNLILSSNQTLVGTAGVPFLSTNVLDLWDGKSALEIASQIPLSRPPSLGGGWPMEIKVQITSAYLASGGASELMVELLNDSVSTLDSAPVVLAKSDAIAKATLVAGYQFKLGTLPPGIAKRYLGFRYTETTNNGTGGTIWAAFDLGRVTTPGLYL